MALQLADRVFVTATANTTVSFTLGSAVTGYQSFAAITNGNTVYYGATDGTNWETGLGTYSTTGPTLTRTTILASSNAGSAVTFVGNPSVWVDYPSSKAVYQDASNNVTLPATLATATELVGPSTSANFTRFPNALAVVANTAAGIQQNESHNIGLMAEGTANAANTAVYGIGVYGNGYTASATRCGGVVGEGHVSASADTGSAIGIRGYANDVHAGGLNIGLYGDASNGSSSYALYMNNGGIFSNVAQTWTLSGNLTFSGAFSVGIPTLTLTNALGTAYGGTNSTATPTLGGVSYGNGSAFAFTSAGTTTTVLHGNPSGAPTWSAVSLTADVSGTLPIANGGTNSTATPTNGGVGYGTGTAHAYSAAGTAGQTLTSAGAASPVWITKPVVNIFTTGAAATYTIPAGCTTVKVTAVGPGGAGGGSATSRGTGGSGGGTAIKWLTGVTPGNTLTYTVGTATGTATAVSSGTQVITTISGGSGTAGTSTVFAASGTAGPAGGAATGGDINVAGQQGGDSFGTSTTAATNASGTGGSSLFGLGGAGVTYTATAGRAGSGYGAGGGGGQTATVGAATFGLLIFEAW